MGNSWDNKATSPQFTTSVTTPSATFYLFNDTMNILNAFGAANTMAMGAVGGRLLIGGAADISSSYSAILKGYLAFNNDRSVSGSARNWGIHTNNTTEGSLEFYCGATEGADPSVVKMAISSGGNVTISGTLTTSDGQIGSTTTRGTISQTTSITASVTINKTRGTITTVSHSYSANTGEIFNVNNSEVDNTDVIECTTQHYGGSINFTAQAFEVQNGSFSIRVLALGSTTAAIVVNFEVRKTA